MRLTTSPTKAAGMGAVGASVLVWVVGGGEVVAVAVVVVDVVPVAAGCVVVGVPLAEEVGVALVAVAIVVGPTFGVGGEELQAATIISTPTAKVVALARGTVVRTVANLLRQFHCRPTDLRRVQNVGRPADGTGGAPADASRPPAKRG
jgi:hypothetical protein